jgi:hypothetical protein
MKRGLNLLESQHSEKDQQPISSSSYMIIPIELIDNTSGRGFNTWSNRGHCRYKDEE